MTPTEFYIQNNRTNKLNYIPRNAITLSTQFNCISVEIYKEQLLLTRDLVIVYHIDNGYTNYNITTNNYTLRITCTGVFL